MKSTTMPRDDRSHEGEAELPATVRALGWTSFLTDLSSEAIYPLLPGFVKGLGGSGVDIGLVDGLANAVAAVVRLPAGMLSDRFGRRRLVLVGYGLSALIRPLMGLVGTPPAAVAVRTVDRLGKGIRSAPRDALVVDLVPPADRGRAFGHIRALDHVGAAAGPLVAMLFLLAFPGSERRLFLLTLLPGLATLAVIWHRVRDVAPRAAVTAARPESRGRLGPSQAALLACVAVWALGASSEQFLLLRVASLGVPQAFVPLVWFAISLAKSLAAARAGRLADTLRPRPVLAAAWLLFAMAYGCLACTASLPATLALVMVVGVAYGIAEPAERTLVAALAPDDRQGGAFGWYALVQGLLALPASLLAGWLWDRGAEGGSLAFAVTAVVALAACCLLLATGRAGRPGGRAPLVSGGG